MKGLLLAAHGSRKKASNDEIFQRTQQLAEGLKHEFDVVRCAFLEFAAPSMSEQIEQMVRLGITHIIIVPFFLAAGKHVLTDIPVCVREAEEKYPTVTLTVTTHFGGLDGVTGLIMDEVRKTYQRRNYDTTRIFNADSEAQTSSSRA